MLLCLDLGMKCGFALAADPVVSGMWDMSKSPQSERFWLLYNHLVELHETHTLTGIVYEDVHGHTGTIAAQCYGGYKAIVMLFVHQYGLMCHGVSPSTLKKVTTGSGKATKSDMETAILAMGYMPTIVRRTGMHDDNEIDALALLAYSRTHL